MKKYLSIPISVAMGIFLIVSLSSQKPLQGKFYYAFDEKIYMNPIPNKFALAFENKTKADNAISKLSVAINRQKIKRLNETVLIAEISSDQQIEQVTSSIKNDIVIQKPAYTAQKQELYYIDEIIFEPKQGVNKEEILRIGSLSNSSIKEEKQFFTIVQIPSTVDACDIANKIQESGLVKFCHPNFIMPLEAHQVIPNDTYFNNQYYLRNTGQIFNPAENHAGVAGADIKASWAWTMTTGNNAIIVAVLDQGVTANHPDLPNARQIRLNGSNFIIGENANDPTPNGNDNHGNACSGIIAATQNNNEGISGIAPNVRIMPIKILGGNIDNARIANAIDFAWQNGADILSNSWGTGFTNPNAIPVIVQAIQRATTQGRNGLGCVVAFSASNSASHAVAQNGQVRFPSNVQINGVLTVGASNRFDQQSDYSPTSNVASPENQIIDIVAPSHNAYPPEIYAFHGGFGGIAGETFEVWTIDIPGNAGYNTWTEPGYGNFPAVGETLPNFGVNNLSYTGRMGGTSAACPQVAAVASLILSLNPNLTQQQVFDILINTADDVGGYTYVNGWCPEIGNGRLDACEAVGQVFPLSISGPSIVCNTETYSIPNLPAGANVTWNGDSWLTITPQGPSGSTALVTNNGISGTSYLTATITSVCGTSMGTINRLITIGAPNWSTISTAYYTQGYNGGRLHDMNCLSTYFDPPGYSGDISVTDRVATSYTWTFINKSPSNATVAISYFDPFDPRNATVSVRKYGGSVTYRLTTSNACGSYFYDYTFTTPHQICNVDFSRTMRDSAQNLLADNNQSTDLLTVPNPSSGSFVISLKNGNIKQVIIRNTLGAEIKRYRFNSGSSKLINIQDLPSAIYLIEVFDGQKWLSTKLLKQ